ncbi:uncharacterized protein LOC105180859 isoform X2 [Harpegnathos saltator]|uniref:uncharacterized protein LOC105180859 isoform X2 n=1 Tax=Harpegnathos saltator TaxID=610380 RepID=UPI000DBED988|nr:uncharacterized protein LOC105180859 isoform X2 [Harpegnathos saltator]
MWEQRSDKKRKLKHNAVPTIFEYFVKKQIPVTIPNTIEETQQPVYEKHIAVNEKQTVINDIVEPAPAPTTSLLNDIEHIEVNEKQMVINDTVEPAPVLTISSLKDKVCTSPASDTKEKIANKKLEERNEKLQQRIMLLRKQNKVLRSQIQSLQKSDTNNKYKQVLKKVFHEDQIKALLTKHRSTKCWSNITVQRALKLRFACGITGYEEFLQQKIHLPSLRILQRRIENLKFESGISNDMFHFLQMKVSTFQNDTDRECGLVLDEMNITPKHVYDSSTKTLLRNITLPHEQGGSFNGETMKDIIFQIIKKAEDIGLHVNYVTSVMGPGNDKIWKCYGINVGRYSSVKNYIPHPSNPDRVLYFIADVPHLLKNLKESLFSNQFFLLPEQIVTKYNLPSNRVESAHFNDLIESQKDLEFYLTPKLRHDDIHCTNTYNKMRVNKVRSVLSTYVSSSLEFLAKENQKPELYTTAWFVKQMSRWFSLMTSRSCCLALGLKNIDIYNDSISFLREVIELFTNIKIGNKGVFKPVQRGIILSTTSVIDLVEFLLNERNFKFVSTDRFTQDCVENVFSVLRQRHVISDALQFKNNLKLVAISMFTKPILTGNYEIDDSEYLPGSIDYLTSKKNNVSQPFVSDASTIVENIPPFDISVVTEYNNI